MKMKDEDERMRGRRGKRERKEEERLVTVVIPHTVLCIVW